MESENVDALPFGDELKGDCTQVSLSPSDPPQQCVEALVAVDYLSILDCDELAGVLLPELRHLLLNPGRVPAFVPNEREHLGLVKVDRGLVYHLLSPFHE